MRPPTYALAAGFILSGAHAYAANINLVGVVRDRPDDGRRRRA